MSRPCGNLETTATALAVGVRMSKPPFTASTGTFGSGPGPRGAPPEGSGQPRQKCPLPIAAAQLPNRPEGAGRKRLDGAVVERRAAGDRGVDGPGKRPVVADGGGEETGAEALRRVRGPCSRQRDDAPEGLEVAAAAARMTAGSSAARPGLRSASTMVDSRSRPVTRTFLREPLGVSTFTCAGFAARRFATATVSPTKSDVAERQSVPAQNCCKAFGNSRSDVPRNGSSRSVGTIESSSSRSTFAG